MIRQFVRNSSVVKEMVNVMAANDDGRAEGGNGMVVVR
jgi:hypothetical protein